MATTSTREREKTEQDMNPAQPMPGDGKAVSAADSQDAAATRSPSAEHPCTHPARPQAWMSGLQPADPGPRFDPSVPHPARVYTYWLGGKGHYRADRRAAEQVIRSRPQVVAGARANRMPCMDLGR